jgi:hypothetical protein
MRSPPELHREAVTENERRFDFPQDYFSTALSLPDVLERAGEEHARVRKQGECVAVG